jgi:hypothetical protein
MMASNPNVSMRTLQGWLGPSDPATTAIYAHFAPSAHEADRIEEVFAGLALPPSRPAATPATPAPRV